jgi:actinorhodin biosynthesis protein ActVIA
MLKRKVVGFVIAAACAVAVASGHAQERSGSVVLTTQDYLDIHQLYASLARGLDSAEGSGYAFARNFVADGVQGKLVGHKALAEFAQNWHDNRNGKNIRHSTSNLIITPTPEGAAVSAYLLMLNVGEKPATIFGTASEEDIVVKTPEGWRFKIRAIRADTAAP